VRLGKGSIMGALYKGFWTATGLALLGIPGAFWLVLNGDLNQTVTTTASSFPVTSLIWASYIGLAVTALIVWITEYYTGTNHRPVQSIAKASQTGHGTNVIQGLAISLESTALPTLVIVVAVIATYQLARIIRVAFPAPASPPPPRMGLPPDAHGPAPRHA